MVDKNLQIASEFIAQIDDDWAQLVRQIGTCRIQVKTEREPYEALVRAVAYQQLSTQVGDVIIQRFIDLYGSFPSPEKVLGSTFDALRGCGFSGRKVATIQGIAQAYLDGIVPARVQVDAMSNDALIEQLVSLKGIGRWTVEMMLIFTLQRMDVLPIDDLGIRQGYQRLKRLPKAPTPKVLGRLGEAWQPYRSVASWYLWQVPK